MDWTTMRITLPPEDIDTAVTALVARGISGFAIEDPREFEEMRQSSVYFDYVDESLLEFEKGPAYLTIYIPENQQGVEMLYSAREAVAQAEQETGHAMPYALSSINEQDWANNWKKYFKPIPVGERLLIKPSWEDVEDAQGRVILEIDPSSSFGTGTHATTQLCMEQLEKYLRPGDDVLDMGCGSGILGVAAMLLEAGSVTGVDIEQNAVETALENARRNGISQASFAVRQGNILEDSALRETIGARRYDVILANIVADVVIAMSPLFHEMVKAGGVVITSGIITERIDDVVQGMTQAGLAVKEIVERDDWASVIGEIKP